jgi:hypothetical protein
VLANGYKPGALPAGVASADPRDSLRQGLYAFLFGGSIPTKVTPPLATSVNFPVLGICMLRSTNGAMMSFDYGPFLGHGQRDKMGITLFANQKLWLADYGTPGYGASILPWYQSTFAHNTVVVDGKSQAPTKENKVQLWLGGADLEAASSETTNAYSGVAHSRTVVRIGDYFVVADRLRSEAQHTFDLYLHSEGELSVQGAKTGAQPIAAPVQWIENLTAQTPVMQITGRWAEGGAGIGFWISGKTPLTPLTGQCPAESGSRRIPLLVSRQKGREAEFVTLIYPYQADLHLTVDRVGNTLHIRHGDSLDLLTLPADRTRPTVERSSFAAGSR